MMQSTTDAKVVVVMGTTGAGKSSLVRLATGDEDVHVGDGLKSATKMITPYFFKVNEVSYCLVDTPGFDDTYESDQTVLERLSMWLSESYRGGTLVSAVLYLHRISDVRIQGSTLGNFRIFRALCGDDYASRICLCTTFWDLYQDSLLIPAQRLEALQEDDFWGEMCNRGSKVCKAPIDQPELQALIASLAQPKAIALKVQHEVVDEGKPHNETSAMKSLFEVEMERQMQQHKSEMEEVKAKFEEDMRAKEKKFADDFEKMNQKFEETLQAQREETERVTSEMKRRLSEQARPVSTGQRPPLPPRRAKTDFQAVTEDPVAKRRQKVQKYETARKSTTNVLTMGKNNGHVKCDFKPIQQCYLATCDNCMLTIGSGKCYECKECFDESNFGALLLCERCYNDSTVNCNSEKHDKNQMIETWLLEYPSRCPWVNNPPQDRRMMCVKCGQAIGICYLHCCDCNESWDMCVNCAIRGKHCPGHRRKFPRTPHRMNICFRYMGDAC